MERQFAQPNAAVGKLLLRSGSGGKRNAKRNLRRGVSVKHITVAVLRVAKEDRKTNIESALCGEVRRNVTDSGSAIGKCYVKKLCLNLILMYKRFFSKELGQNCIYTPTCSMYCYNAIEQYGWALGILLGAARILRCNPFAKGGFDPVKENLRGKGKWTL